MKLCIKTKQFQNEVLDFFVILMIYGVKHQSRAISEQKAISEQSSKFLCTTDGL